MPYLNSLYPLVLLCFLFACGNAPSAERQDYLNQEWVFALDNPEGSPFLMDPLSVGDVASFRGDTVILNNHFTGLENKLKLVVDPTVLDSNKQAITAEQVGENLNLTLYLHDSLITSAIFEPNDSPLTVAPPSEYLGKTFLFNDAENGSSRIYFGNDPKLKRTKDIKDYYVISDGNTEDPVSFRRNGNGSDARSVLGGFSPIPMRGSFLFLFFGRKKGSLGARPFVVNKDEEGNLSAHYVVETNGAYAPVEVELTPIVSIIPETVSLETISRQLNEGRLTVDTSYPPADTFGVSFAYEESFLKKGGIHYRDLPGLEINFNPDGEYFLFSGDRLLEHRNWQLSPDRNYLILINKDGSFFNHLPILKYTDESIEFRLPLSISTREPKGVELTSYVKVDAYIQVKK